MPCVQAQPRGHLCPPHAEDAGLKHQHMVAGRQQIDQRRFPRAMARGGIEEYMTPGANKPLQPGNATVVNVKKLCVIKVNGATVHCT